MKSADTPAGNCRQHLTAGSTAGLPEYLWALRQNWARVLGQNLNPTPGAPRPSTAPHRSPCTSTRNFPGLAWPTQMDRRCRYGAQAQSIGQGPLRRHSAPAGQVQEFYYSGLWQLMGVFLGCQGLLPPRVRLAAAARQQVRVDRGSRTPQSRSRSGGVARGRNQAPEGHPVAARAGGSGGRSTSRRHRCLRRRLRCAGIAATVECAVRLGLRFTPPAAAAGFPQPGASRTGCARATQCGTPARSSLFASGLRHLGAVAGTVVAGCRWRYGRCRLID